MRLLIRPEAREDLKVASTWYAAQAPGLGNRFLAALRAQLLFWQRFVRNCCRSVQHQKLFLPFIKERGAL